MDETHKENLDKRKPDTKDAYCMIPCSQRSKEARQYDSHDSGYFGRHSD